MAERHLPRGASFAYSVAERNLDEQLARIEALDGKAGILMATDGVLAGLLFARSSLLFEMPRSLAAVTVTLVGASLLLALTAFATRQYRTAPQADPVIRMMSAGEDWLRWRFLGNLQESLDRNNSKLTAKARWLSAALFSLMGAIALLVGYFLFSVLNGGLES